MNFKNCILKKLSIKALLQNLTMQRFSFSIFTKMHIRHLMEETNKTTSKSTSKELESNILLKKQLKEEKQSKEQSKKLFTNMLTTASRNNYTLNQMVDRKARILLSINALILSLIISKIIINTDIKDFKFIIYTFSGIASMISIVFSMLAVKPNKKTKKFTVENMHNQEGNPLFYGNFINLSEEVYQNTLLEKREDIDFIHKSLIQDIYHIGKSLDKKRLYLTNSINILMAGLSIALVMSILYRMF